MFTRLASLALLCASAFPVARAADPAPFLKPNDVIALVGGEDMVAASEYGYLELLLQRALPSYHLKFRSLAWEGDTVFEQPRDLNYPSLEQQLDDLGATVVIMQFGQMESLAGTSKLPEFIKAYEKLIERVGAGGKRRVVVQVPDEPSEEWSAEERKGWSPAIKRAEDLAKPYRAAITQLRDQQGPRTGATLAVDIPQTRDGFHRDASGHDVIACNLASRLLGQVEPIRWHHNGASSEDNTMLTAIRAKNRYWYHYTRPQNWAFLNGDRTEQPSSRDHLDPSKRWFPEEMKQWLPLIDAKEKEIWDLAAKASAESAKETKPAK